MNISAVITTAPRKEPTLGQCVESLHNCGIIPNVLAEPDSPYKEYITHQNTTKLGVWRNWVKSVRIALESSAQYILTVQDDSVFHPDSISFSEIVVETLPPDYGFLSLYTPRHYSVRSSRILRKNPTLEPVRPVGVNRIYTKSLWGACALLFPRTVLETIIEDPIVNKWTGMRTKSGNKEVIQRRKDNPHMIANSDAAIGKLVNKQGLSMWFLHPSPVAHIAKYSAIAHGGNSGNRNAYIVADHSLPLSHQIPL